MAMGLLAAQPLVQLAAATREVSVGNFFFEDNVAPAGEIAATAGDTIRFTIANGTHDLHIDELGLHTPRPLKSGESAELVINQPGTFRLHCSVKHGSNTHETRLIVSEASPTTTSDAGGGSDGSVTTTTAGSTSGGSSGGTVTTASSSTPTGGTSSGGTSGSATGGGTTSGVGATSAGGGDASSTVSTNAAGQRVTAEGEVLATPEGASGAAGDGSAGDGVGGGGGSSGASTLEVFAADGSPIRPSSAGDGDWIGIAGVVLLMAGVVVLFRRPGKDDDADEDEHDDEPPG